MGAYFNRYTAVLLCLYLATMYVLNNGFGRMFVESFLFSLAPLIINFMAIVGAYQLSQEKTFDHLQAVYYQFLAIISIMGVSYLCIILTQYDNPDVRGWWSIGYLFHIFVAIAFSCIVSFVSQLKPSSMRYTQIFAGATGLTLLCIGMSTYNDKVFYGALGVLFVIHTILTAGAAIYKKIKG